MTMQFIWQGCDAILAAPIALDMIRLADLALKRGEAGRMIQLSSFFKNPLGVEEHDLHAQFHALIDYLQHHLEE
jgi:myo-inositol-1-phosphate synthase